MNLVNALLIALATYSRIPVPAANWEDGSKRYALCFFPVIGAVIGALLVAWLRLCDALALGGMLRGVVAAMLPLLVTGGIHMDGFMDTCDALASWQPPEKRLEILKDSHIGAFAALGCCVYLMLFAGVMSEATARGAGGLACCFVLSRSMSALGVTCLRRARKGGMLFGFARAAENRAVVYVCLAWMSACLAGLIGFCGLAGAAAFAASAMVLAYYRHMAYTQFGGVTGDLAGWFLQVAELVSCAVIVIGGKLL